MDYPPGLPVWTEEELQGTFTWDQLGRVHNHITGQIIDKPYNAIVPTHCQISGPTAMVFAGENIVLEHRLVLDRDIEVKAGATLTIKCELYMPKHGKITVRKGGKLIIDGGLISNLCGTTWRGIIVEGAFNLPQTEPNQGTVRLINGARIEHASVGIDAGSGAIVKVNDATFHNCNLSVGLAFYHNQQTPGGPVAANEGHIKNATFEIDGILREPSYNSQGNALAPLFVFSQGVEGFVIRIALSPT
jgi:hypothetical protein